MGRKSVYVPDELIEQVDGQCPDLNLSALLQESLRRLLAGACEHRRLTCQDCNASVSRAEVSAAAVGEFCRVLLAELEPLVDKLGTAVGAAQVAKRVAVEFGVPDAEHKPLPRPARAAYGRR